MATRTGGYYGGYSGGGGGGGYSVSSGGYRGEGSVRLKVKQRQAEVYVDGYFVGRVDEFDGSFQKLDLDGGASQGRAQGRWLRDRWTFEVLITPGETVTYKGELKRIK